MTDSVFNLFENVPNSLDDEQFLELVRSPHVSIERIVSTGHTTPRDTWCDQPENEWVVVLQGAAEILFEGEEQPRALKAGDALNIPSHCRHRVVRTDSTQPTVWLAVHYE
jgi:cupin 2 domain-containing protein